MSDNGKKYFPIQSGVACQLKWTWNTIRLQEGTSHSCHRVDPVKLTADTFDNFHNHDTWLEHRNMMKQGKFPQQGCQYCENIERAGGTSDRMTHLKTPNLYPKELDEDINAIHVTPRILEVYLDNVCNMGCIYCDESNSSWLQTENKKFGYIKNLPFEFKIDRHAEFDQLVEKFFSYLENNYYELKRLLVLGGEPFYQRNFDRLIEFIKQHNNKDLQFNIVTNLSLPKKKLEIFIEEMQQLIVKKQIGRLDITVSLDCWGNEQEYVRYGLDLDVLKENFEFLASKKWITLMVNSTITSLTIKTMPDMIEYLNSFRKNRNIYHSFGHVDYKRWLHCDVFGAGFFDKEFQQILDVMPDLTDWDKNQKDYMLGLWKSLNSVDKDKEKINQLELYLDEIDRRRNTNWKLTFSWLNEYLKEHHVV
jgi:organic radical activating enzyme